jgi:hypothetical protein
MKKMFCELDGYPPSGQQVIVEHDNELLLGALIGNVWKIGNQSTQVTIIKSGIAWWAAVSFQEAV